MKAAGPVRYRYPFSPYPTGWYQVAWSGEIAPGEVAPLRYFGRDLVLYRTQAGEPVVLDAHCPHLGAHLGHGGAVVAEDASLVALRRWARQFYPESAARA